MKEKSRNYYTHARTDILRLIPKSARKILDVGCGEGVLGKQIKELDDGIEVTGIEKDPVSCNKAEAVLDSVILGDVESLQVSFKENYFDCIIAGDILEHLVDPWKTLENLRHSLKDEGLVISSIPNIRYYKALIRLLCGYWDYADWGIFDRSHLRFFCLTNIKEMFREAGFEIEHIGRNRVSARGFRVLNYLCVNRLKEFLTYQYYIVARKTAAPVQAVPKREIIKF